MMKPRFIATCCALLCLTLGWTAGAAEQVTFFKDVLPIVQENCQVCHRDAGADMGGMIAPMSLTTYNEVRPWAKAIAKQVAAKSMPPWHASPDFHGVFQNERTLTDEEIETIVAWTNAGAKRGNPNDAPEPMNWPTSKWQIGEPDLIVKLPEPYLVTDDVEDEYVDIPVTITKNMLPEPRWIKAAEIHNGSNVVHHVIARPLAGNAPGIGARVYPDGYGALLSPGDVVTFQMHYHKEAGPGTAVYDQTEIGIKFHTDPVHHPMTTTPIGNTAFQIPPGVANWPVGASRIFEEDTLLVSMMPHMHLRGKDARYTAYYPDGSQEELLYVPRYDFNWQTPYEYDEPKLLPKGTRVDVIMHFDNSADNPYNPDPTDAVVFDGPTTAEMMLGWIYITSAEPQPDPLARNGDSNTSTD